MLKISWHYLFTMVWVRVLEICPGKVSPEVMERSGFHQGTRDGAQLLPRALLRWEPSHPLSCLRTPDSFGAGKDMV